MTIEAAFSATSYESMLGSLLAYCTAISRLSTIIPRPAASTAHMNLSALKSLPFRSYIISLHRPGNGFGAQCVIIGWLARQMTGFSFVGLVAFPNLCRHYSSAHYSALWRTASMSDGEASAAMPLPACSRRFLRRSPFLASHARCWRCLLMTGTISSTKPSDADARARLAPPDLPSVHAITALISTTVATDRPAVGGLLIQIIGALLAFALTAAVPCRPGHRHLFHAPARQIRSVPPANKRLFERLHGGAMHRPATRCGPPSSSPGSARWPEEVC